jgi:hypothetical protein
MQCCGVQVSVLLTEDNVFLVDITLLFTCQDKHVICALSVVLVAVLLMEKCVPGGHSAAVHPPRHVDADSVLCVSCRFLVSHTWQVSVLLTEDNVFLVDIRHEEAREAEGLPQLKLLSACQGMLTLTQFSVFRVVLLCAGVCAAD